MVGLGDLPGGVFESFATSVSTGGVIVGGGWPLNALEGFSWTQDTGMTGLGFLPGGDFRSEAFEISEDSSTIVGWGYNAQMQPEAYSYTELTGMVGLGELPGGEFESDALGVSSDGSVIVGSSRSEKGIEAYRWTAAEGMVGLGDLPAGDFLSVATDVSGSGEVIVGYSGADVFQGNTYNQAFRWTAEAGMVGLGHLPGGLESVANAISSDGSTIVGSDSQPFAGPQATVWRQSIGMRSIQDLLQELGLQSKLENWKLVAATDVSADGRFIVGYGINPDGFEEAWLASVPEPSSFAIATAGIAGGIGALAAGHLRRSKSVVP